MSRAIKLCEAMGITGSDKLTMAEMLKRYLADLYVAYTKAQGFHWNVTSPNFRSMHKDFGDQYTALHGMIDSVAERVRSLDAFPPGCLKGMLDLSTLPETPDVPSPTMMVETMATALTYLADVGREINRMATEVADEGTIDLIGGQVESLEKMAWMMKSSK